MEIVTKGDVGLAVREWRKSEGVTQMQAASAFGVSQAAVCAFEQGEHRFREEVAFKVEEFTGGAIKAEDCVSDDRRWIVLEMKAAREASSS
jgi:transcriptional regulator with XRE-family HTH domain